MASVRVTQSLLVDRALNNLQDQQRQILQIQQQLSTGRRVVNVSDSPLDARFAIATRSDIARNEQYLKNIDTVTPVLRQTDSTIQEAVDVLQRVRELTLQGANNTNSQDDLDAIAEEVDQLLEHAFSLSNAQSNNRFIFAGTRSTVEAFSATRDPNGEITAVTYDGNDELIEVAVADDVTAVVNEPGSRLFQGTQDIHQLLINIRDDLRAGNTANLQTARLTEIDQGEEQLLAGLSRVGSVDNRLTRITDSTENFNVELNARRSDAVDADFAETIINLNAQSNAYQAALNAAARVIQPSLLQFIG